MAPPLVRGPALIRASPDLLCGPPLIRSSNNFVQGPTRVIKVPLGQEWTLTNEALDELLCAPKKKIEERPPVFTPSTAPAIPAAPTATAAIPAAPTATAVPAAPPPPPAATPVPATTGPPEPPNLGPGEGVAPATMNGDRAGAQPFSWLRFNNTEPARQQRRHISTLTRQATAAGGYKLQGRSCLLTTTEEMVRKTKCIARSCNTLESPSRIGEFFTTIIRGHEGFTLDVAEELMGEYADKVGVVSAASTYHCGGGFLTGGRHALEEAICCQTTLFLSLSKIRRAKIAEAGGKDSSNISYIPADGVILSPQVEIFRNGTNQGYAFLQTPRRLGAIISVAMFNKNPEVRDAPLDAPTDGDEYERCVRDKCRGILAATVEAGCRALVMNDAGCGVYRNDPRVIGRIFGEVLRREFWCHVEEVVLVGKLEFREAVQEAVKEEEDHAVLRRRTTSFLKDLDLTDIPEPLPTSKCACGQALTSGDMFCGRCGARVLEVDEDASSEDSRSDEESSKKDDEKSVATPPQAPAAPVAPAAAAYPAPSAALMPQPFRQPARPTHSGVRTVWQFQTRSGWKSFGSDCQDVLEAEYQTFKNGGCTVATIQTSGIVVTVDFVKMTQQVGENGPKRAVRREEQEKQDLAALRSQQAPTQVPSQVPVWKFSVKSGYQPFDHDVQESVEAQYQLFLSDRRRHGRIISRGKVILLNFELMTQRLENSDRSRDILRDLE